MPAYRYAPLDGLTKAVQVGVGVSLAGEAVACAMEFKLLSLLPQFEAGTVGAAEADAFDAMNLKIAIGLIATFVIVAIMFLVWVHRANRNLHALEVREVEYTPGWAVGSWFIPILNIFRPYAIMREIWRGSRSPSNSAAEGHASVPASLGVWWGAWLVAGVLESLSASFVRGESPSMDDFKSSAYLSIGSSLLNFVAGVIIIVLIGTIAQSQMRKKQGLASQPPPRMET